jgi:cellulose/xylan binding protein with CBM9 domain/glycosyl hydrolase family 20
MKKLLSIAVFFCLTQNVFLADQKPLIIPTPKLMSNGEWNTVISSTAEPLGQIIIKGDSILLKTAANEINKFIIKNGGKALPLTQREGKDINIILSSNFESIEGFDLSNIEIPDNKKMSKQAYVIRFNKNNILLAGSGDAGALYAAITFCHMLKNKNERVVFYSAKIDDYPDFEFRGDSAPGDSYITRGYLFNQKRLQTDRTYEETLKDYIDICLHLKMNLMHLNQSNLVFKGKDYTDEVIKYSKERGFTLSSSVYASFFIEKKGKNSNLQKLNNYLKKTRQKKSDLMEHRGRYFAWSNEELLRQMVRDKAIKGVNIYYHCPDTGDENWGKRGDKCRKIFGNDRAKADAFVLNTIYDELKKLNPGDKNINIFAVIQPYHPLYIDPKYYKYYKEYVDHFERLNKSVPKEIPFCVRECSRDSLIKWNNILKGRPFYLYHEHRQFHGATQLIASNIRNVKTFYFPERSGDIFSFKISPVHWELDMPLGAQYSWNTDAPGSGLIDMNNRFEFDIEGKLNQDFEKITLPATIAYMWGKEATACMTEVYTSRLNITLVIDPFSALKALSRQSFWKRKKLLPELTPEMFKKQAKAADLVCRNTQEIMKGKIPVPFYFLKGRATRLYKHSMVVKLLAPVYVHYFAAVKALEEKNIKKAETEIEKAGKLNSKIPAELEKQKQFVKQFCETSSSFLSASLRKKKPFQLLTKKIEQFKIPSKEEIAKTSASSSLIQKIQTRNIIAQQILEAPVIDGKLNDTCWQKNNYPITDFVRYPFTGKPKLAYDQTSVKVCFDKNYLYIAITALDNDFDSISGKDLKHDDPSIFSNDIVEVFMNPNKANLNTAQFIVNAAGSSSDIFYKKKNEYKKFVYKNEWNPVWKKATSLDDKGWIAEIAIPFSCLKKEPLNEINLAPKPGDKWRIYFSREKRSLEFSGVKFLQDGSFTSTDKYPTLIFIK